MSGKSSTGSVQDFPIEVDVVVSDNRWMQLNPDVEQLIHNAIFSALSGAGIPLKGPAEICLMLTNDFEQRALNKKWRGIDKSTNVLSFPQVEAFESPFGILGDLVLAHETIAREANEQGKSFSNHLNHLIIHGFLHILGYDHQNDKEAEQMESLEIDILSKMGITNPYLD